MKAALALALLLLSAGAGAAEPVVPIRLNGPDQNRVNVTILGDGYTQGELLKFSTDADLLVQSFFAQSPYSDYASYFNVYRIDVVSSESGADHPERGVQRNTALGAAYNCGGIQRLICVDQSAVNAVLSRSLPTALRDIVVVLVNDAEYGGSGGVFAVTSTHVQSVEIILHEIGHSFGLLGDEYSDSPPPCNNSIEPAQPNIAKETSRDALKWAIWVDAATPLPTPAGSAVGAYEGALFCTTGLFRPTPNSKMRSLGRPFDAINTEQLIRRIYNLVSPLDGESPEGESLSPDRGAPVTFSVEAMRPSGRELSIGWFVDGAAAGSGPVVTLQTALLPAGEHRVEVEVRDGTPAVRQDPLGTLTARHAWTLTVQQATPDDIRQALEDMLERWRHPR